MERVRECRLYIAVCYNVSVIKQPQNRLKCVHQSHSFVTHMYNPTSIVRTLSNDTKYVRIGLLCNRRV